MIDVIRKALDSHLASLPLGVPIAWPNIPFDPNGAYLRPTLLPNRPDQAELGRDGRNVHEGIYQVDAFYPSGYGVRDAEATCEALIAAFKRGTIIVSPVEIPIIEDGVIGDESIVPRVRCDRAGYRPASSQEPNSYQMIVEIDYRAYLPN